MTQEELKMELEELAVRFSEGWHEGIKIDASDIMLLNEAAQALAQPEQEPVAYYLPHKGFYWAKPTSISAPTIADVEPLPLYTTPPQRTEQCNYPDCKCPTENPCLKGLAQPEQESVAWKPTEADYKEWCDRHDLHEPIDRNAFYDAASLYLTSTPPQRTWVGLTKEQIAEFGTWHDNREEEVGWVNPSEIVAYIDAKLKEKNCG